MNKRIKSELPLVSVLLPVYGVEQYIGECIDSLAAQTYPELEIIFVNDCTPDGSRAVIEKRLKDMPHLKARIIDNEHNLGLASTRNVGLDVASGKYVCFVDSDDRLPANAIALMVAKAEQTGADIVRGQVMRFCGNKFSPFMTDAPGSAVEYRQAVLDWGTYTLGVWGGLYRRELLEKNMLRFFDGLNFGEDFGMTCRLAYCSQVTTFIDHPVYYYRVNPASMTQNYKEKNAQELIEIADKVLDFYRSKPDYDYYSAAIKRGRARMKAMMLLQLGSDLAVSYTDVFPDLKDSAGLPLALRLKLRAMEHGLPTIYKIINKLEKWL